MVTLYTRAQSALLILLAGLLTDCRDVPPPASRLIYVGADRTETARRPSGSCAFRYALVNTFSRLDNASQREAIRAGFGLWQRANPRVGFLELPNRAELLVRFDKLPASENQPVTLGLLGGSAPAVSALRREANGTYVIVLSDSFAWDANALTKAIAYQAGLFLGMAASGEPASVMRPLFLGQPTTLSRADSLTINGLYTTSCPDLTSVRFLPCSLKVSGPVTKTIKFDQQGTIAIRAVGQINVGIFVGLSGPEGKLEGGFITLPLDDYNIVRRMYHAALMYKIDNEADWHYWGDERTFTTNGRQYVELTFNVNDNNQTDNTGAYDVLIDYQ